MKISIDLKEGDKLHAAARQHSLTLWQGDSVTREKSLLSSELFLISLGSCMMGTMLNFADNLGYEIRSASFYVESGEVEYPQRLDNINVKAEIDAELRLAEIERLIRVATHCKIHNTLKNAPNVNFKISVKDSRNRDEPSHKR